MKKAELSIERNVYQMENQILIIDDDVKMAELLKKCVAKEGFVADVCYNGEDGIRFSRSTSYVLIVLDVMLPGISGFDVLTQIRLDSKVPVLMLTAKGDREDKVHGLRSGADDYLTKPFDVEEFMARVASLTRRYTTLNNGATEAKKLSFHGLEVDLDAGTVFVNGNKVDLLAKEFDILCYLAKNQGKILTKKQIYEEIWNESYAYDDNNIMGHISKLRKQIEPDPACPTYIQTIKGMGYRFNSEV